MKTIKAYKFRSSSQIAFALDMVFNNRLYCSDWSNLNDPMEGIFGYSYHSTSPTDYSEKVAEIIREQKRIRICSLSLTYDCHLLWAHYASGFDGLAVEIELPANSSKVKKINYGGVFSVLPMKNNMSATKAANTVLTSKYREWSYEQEVRILNHSEWYNLKTPVKRIIAGHRMNPALFETLRIICHHKNVTLNRTGIGDEGIDADYVPPLGSDY